jgi:hypothetical protein
VKIAFQVDDRIATAAAGAIASIGAAAAAAVLLRRSARIQAARSALLGRPTAYRLHLRGTGIELAPWERNFVAEVVVRQPPENGVYMGPDVPVRPDLGGSVIRDSMFVGAPGASIRFGAGSDVTADAPDDLLGADAAEAAWEVMDRYAQEGPVGDYKFLPAFCGDGHEFEAEGFARLRDRASITQRTPVALTCPECEGPAQIKPGRYFIRDGQVVREDLPPEGDA